MNFDNWTNQAPGRLREDPLWKSRYYQYAMCLYDLTWEDCEQLNKDFRGREVAKQLIRSCGSIGANMVEAYGRAAGTPDHRRVLRISLGEARETKGWYLRARHIISEDVLKSRLDILDQIIALLVSIVFRK